MNKMPTAQEIEKAKIEQKINMIKELDKEQIEELLNESELCGDRLLVKGLLKINEIIKCLNSKNYLEE